MIEIYFWKSYLFQFCCFMTHTFLLLLYYPWRESDANCQNIGKQRRREQNTVCWTARLKVTAAGGQGDTAELSSLHSPKQAGRPRGCVARSVLRAVNAYQDDLMSPVPSVWNWLQTDYKHRKRFAPCSLERLHTRCRVEPNKLFTVWLIPKSIPPPPFFFLFTNAWIVLVYLCKQTTLCIPCPLPPPP